MSLRYDLKIIDNLITKGSSVLDIGCGEGLLLKKLKDKKCSVKGMEIDITNAQKAVEKGLSVIQGDAESDLKYYPDNSFDYVIMAETIQATKQPKEILEDLFRIGKSVIISIPNFGYYKNRLQLMFKGVMPVNKHLSYQWYETPNIHFCTVRDLENLFNEINVQVTDKLFISNNKKTGRFMANLFSEKAVFVLKRF